SGTIKLEGETLQFTQPADAVAKGIAMLPENRRDQALFSDRSIRVNTVMSHLNRFARGILKIPNVSSENEKTKEQIDRLMIKATGPRQLVRELSGGNQQKVVVGRWLCGEVKVFLVDEPTKGVDIAGKSEILLELRRLAASGSAVIVVSSQLEEVADVSDRVLVLNEGKVAGLLDGPTTENEILQACYKAEAA
ncbi:MAG: ATP-binding cassette domain-containing protein, partial [Actinomycetota bacterium]|nr:ATP-binding cassette domain-containing protein [Actinomycetota bacterium]MEC9034729.1 ATP-binding cassette domain-containing protein [Actinomycetota bacterium]